MAKALFELKKRKILEQLSVAPEDYSDLSPKGSVDDGVKDLITELNNLPGLVTTSSCAGRISVFFEGRKKPRGDVEASADAAAEEQAVQDSESLSTLAGPGGKGGGGEWLLVSHDPVALPDSADSDLMKSLGLKPPDAEKIPFGPGVRFVHFKFEPMILHMLASSLEEAQLVLVAASKAGFRESGVMNLSPSGHGEYSPMVAVRSMGLAFDSIIGYQNPTGELVSVVDERHLRMLVGVANERFQLNKERIERFRSAFLIPESPAAGGTDAARKNDWEDADSRRQRKRIEGLAKRSALKNEEHMVCNDEEARG